MTARPQSSDPDHKKSFRRRWRSSGPVAKLTLICTGIVAIATVTYAVFAGWQLYEIRQGGKDTRRLAEAAQRQADATSQQANAMQAQLNTMRDQANSMKAQTDTLNKSLAETRKAADAAVTQAQTSQASARAAEQSANIAAESQRPTLEIAEVAFKPLEVGQIPEASISLKNIGHATARRFNARATIAFAIPSIPGFTLEERIRTVRAHSPTTISLDLLGGFPIKLDPVATQTIRPEDMELISRKVAIPFLYVAGDYFDSMSKKRTIFEMSWLYDPDDPAHLKFCSTHNTVTESYRRNR